MSLAIGFARSTFVESADKNTVAAYGDTRTRIRAEFDRQDARDLGLKMGDVVKMQAFLVGDSAKIGAMDFAGFMEGCTKFFGTEAQPNLPPRSVVQVAITANPGFLVEIEVTAVRP